MTNDSKSPLSAFIYGSCVSRDLARIDSERFKVGYYLARQSWISAYAPPRQPPDLDLSSAFQKRMVEGDIRSLGSRLLAGSVPSEHDLVLLDLVDERVGVAPFRGSWVTLSGEMRRVKALPPSAMREAVPFGGDEHFSLWSECARRVREDLDPLMAKVFVLGARFTDVTREGPGVQFSGGLPGAVWNERYERYFGTLRDLGFTIIEQPDELLSSTETHRWGPAPFHYVEDAYRRFGDEIVERLGG